LKLSSTGISIHNHSLIIAKTNVCLTFWDDLEIEISAPPPPPPPQIVFEFQLSVSGQTTE
jgi:hypothetical protein